MLSTDLAVSRTSLCAADYARSDGACGDGSGRDQERPGVTTQPPLGAGLVRAVIEDAMAAVVVSGCVVQRLPKVVGRLLSRLVGLLGLIAGPRKVSVEQRSREPLSH
jgi:hypothetical protein